MKEIKIIRQGEKQLGIRIPSDIYSKLKNLSRKHNSSIQEVIRYILQEEIDQYK